MASEHLLVSVVYRMASWNSIIPIAEAMEHEEQQEGHRYPTLQDDDIFSFEKHTERWINTLTIPGPGPDDSTAHVVASQSAGSQMTKHPRSSSRP